MTDRVPCTEGDLVFWLFTIMNKMPPHTHCKMCGRDVPASDLVNGLCPKCAGGGGKGKKEDEYQSPLSGTVM